jgi:hypothetical protein
MKMKQELYQGYSYHSINHRLVFHLFNVFHDYNIYCSFLQIYNEKISDLLVAQ